jgi:hypothetical protein
MPLDKLAGALGRKQAEVAETIDNADDPRAERRKLERRAERARRRFEDEDEERWLDQLAADARERFIAIRTLTDAELAQRRRRLTLGEQLEQALADANVLTGVAGSNTEGTGGSKPGARGPGIIAGALFEPALQIGHRYRAVIGQLIANLQREIDATVRRPLDRRLEGSAEKERRLFEHWQGVRSEVVATLDPSLGSARSIEIMRRRRGLRPVDGTAMKASKSAQR